MWRMLGAFACGNMVAAYLASGYLFRQRHRPLGTFVCAYGAVCHLIVVHALSRLQQTKATA